MTAFHDRLDAGGKTELVRVSDAVAVEAPARHLVVVGRIAGRRFAWPVASVERVLPMAAVTPVVDLPPGVAGLLDVHGDMLAVVDPRHRLGLPPQAARPEHHLLVMATGPTSGRFLLWVDAVEDIVAVDGFGGDPAESAQDGVDAPPSMARIGGQLVQVLSSAAFAPPGSGQPARGPQ